MPVCPRTVTVVAASCCRMNVVRCQTGTPSHCASSTQARKRLISRVRLSVAIGSLGVATSQRNGRVALSSRILTCPCKSQSRRVATSLFGWMLSRCAASGWSRTSKHKSIPTLQAQAKSGVLRRRSTTIHRSHSSTAHKTRATSGSTASAEDGLVACRDGTLGRCFDVFE